DQTECPREVEVGAGAEPQLVSFLGPTERPVFPAPVGHDAREAFMVAAADSHGFRAKRTCRKRDGSDDGKTESRSLPRHHAASDLTAFRASSSAEKVGRKWCGVFWRPTSMQMFAAWL